MLVNSEQRGLFKTLGLQARDLRRCMCETDVLNNPQRAAKEPHDVGEWAGVLIEHRIGAEQSLIPGSAPIKIGDRHGDMRNRGELSHHAPNSFGDPTLLGGSSFCWGTSTSATPGTIDSRFCDVYNAEAPGRVTAPESAGSVTGPRSITFRGWWRYRLTIRIRRSARLGCCRGSPAQACRTGRSVRWGSVCWASAIGSRRRARSVRLSGQSFPWRRAWSGCVPCPPTASGTSAPRSLPWISDGSLSNDQPFRADLVVRNATLVRAPGAVPIPKSTIVIRDGLIAEGPALAGAQELDAAGAVVTAGFWNCPRPPHRAGLVRRGTQAGLPAPACAGRHVQQPRIRTAGTGIYPGGGLPFYTREAMARLI